MPRADNNGDEIEYDTIGAFYATLGGNLRAFAESRGETAAFCNDPALQLTTQDLHLPGIEPVLCSKTALASRIFSSVSKKPMKMAEPCDSS